MTTALFKLAPGAVVPLHDHSALKRPYVLEGEMTDQKAHAGSRQAS